MPLGVKQRVQGNTLGGRLSARRLGQFQGGRIGGCRRGAPCRTRPGAGAAVGPKAPKGAKSVGPKASTCAETSRRTTSSIGSSSTGLIAGLRGGRA